MGHVGPTVRSAPAVRSGEAPPESRLARLVPQRTMTTLAAIHLTRPRSASYPWRQPADREAEVPETGCRLCLQSGAGGRVRRCSSRGSRLCLGAK